MHDRARENVFASPLWNPVDADETWRAKSESVDIESRDRVYQRRPIEELKSDGDFSERDVREVSSWVRAR